jgi:hypothetical protein
MAAKEGNKFLGILPAEPKVLGIEGALKSMEELAERRDVCLDIASRARDEAERLQRLIDETMVEHQRSLKALAAQLGAR